MKKATIFQSRVPNLIKLVVLCFILFSLHEYTKSQTKRDFPYSMNKKDFFLLPVSIATNLTAGYISDRMVFNLTVEEIEMLDRNNINAFDRPATNNWSRELNSASDVFAKVFPLLPTVFFVPQLYNKQWNNLATLGIMYVEVYMFTKGITVLTKSLTGRIRPYLYNTSFTAEERFSFQEDEAPSASTSFFSGHVSGTFAAAVFLGKAFSDIYGKGTWSYLVWSTSLAMATFTAYCRVGSGEHFPTDVIAGALVGSAIGYFIPVLHNKKFEKSTFSVLPNSFSFVYNF
jgi:membrane-associated phospholipid phosphatase